MAELLKKQRNSSAGYMVKTIALVVVLCRCKLYVVVNLISISGNFYFSSVSTSLAYISPKTKENKKLREI